MSNSEVHLVHRTAVESETVRRLVLRAHAIVGVALLVASMLAPLGRIVAGDQQTTLGVHWTEHVTLTLPRLIGFALDPPSTDRLGGLGAYPFAIPGGLFLVQLGTAVVTVALLANLALCWVVLRDEVGRAARRGALAAAIVLVVGTLLVWLGLTWLPEAHEGTPGPGWGLWLPLTASVWLGSGLRARRELDDV